MVDLTRDKRRMAAAIAATLVTLAAAVATALSCISENPERLIYNAAEVRIDGVVVANDDEFGDGATVTGSYQGGVWIRLHTADLSEITFQGGTP